LRRCQFSCEDHIVNLVAYSRKATIHFTDDIHDGSSFRVHSGVESLLATKECSIQVQIHDCSPTICRDVLSGGWELAPAIVDEEVDFPKLFIRKLEKPFDLGFFSDVTLEYLANVSA